MTTTTHTKPNEEIISYQKLRLFIGIIGLALPVLLVLGCFVLGAGNFSWQHSISHYYYSKMHIVFVGLLGLLGGFLITYKGKVKGESIAANIAGWSAFGIATFPTTYEGFKADATSANQYLSLLNEVKPLWGDFHFGSATLLFICFILFCCKYFQKADEVYTTDIEIKKFGRRKKLYMACGIGIAISIAMIALFNFVIHINRGLFFYTTFIFETTALWCFGIAWLIKGSKALKKIPVIKSMISPLR